MPHGEVEKKAFKEAKGAAQKYLDTRLAEVIWQFNRSWCWTSAYQPGLARKAAGQAVSNAVQGRNVPHWPLMWC